MSQGHVFAPNEESDGPDIAAISSSSVVGVFEVSTDGVVRSANATFANWLGAASARSLAGRRLTELTAEERDWGDWQTAALAGRERNVTVAFESASGPVVLRGDLVPLRHRAAGTSVAALSGIFTNVSEEHRLHRAVQRGARMEALGSLTSGIAHDFNNLLTVLVGNLYLVAEELRDQPKSFAKLKSARDAARRGADLIRQLLAFARREAIDSDVVDPAQVIEGLLPLLRRALGSRVNIQPGVRPDVGRVRCNAAQLESVLVNLSVNARDAIEGNGNVVLSAANLSMTHEEAGPHGLRGGEFVEVSVQDDGAGISEEVLGRVFEPFFTTKAERGGTGLGLSMVRWFAEQSGGAARIRSRPGKGTKVSLLLPRSADNSVQASDMSMPLSTLPSGSERIHVFSVDEGLRTTLRQILEVLGYDVRLSAEPSEALREVRASDPELLLVDLAAAEAPAQRRLLREALDAKPQLKIIVVTDGVDARTRFPDRAQVMAKPFSLADLAGTLRKVLK